MKTKFLLTLTPVSISCLVSSSIYGQNSKFCNTLPINLRQNLVAYYPFCGNAKDKSGHNNNANFVNATLVKDRFGNPNSAYSFNSSLGQYIKGNCSNFPVNARTISVWFRINDPTLHNEILGYGGGVCGSSFFICLNETNHPGTYTTTGHCEANNCSTTKNYPPSSSWNNLIVVTGNSSTKFYLNGVLISTFNNIAFQNTAVIEKDFAFGSIPSTAGFAPYTDRNVSFLNGALDDITIYNSAFDSAKVQRLYRYFKTDVGTAISSQDFNQADLQSDANFFNSLTTYPNPSNGAVTIDFFSSHKGTALIRVKDIVGKAVFIKANEAIIIGRNSIKLNLSHLHTGTYFLELIKGEEIKRIKLLIHK